MDARQGPQSHPKPSQKLDFCNLPPLTPVSELLKTSSQIPRSASQLPTCERTEGQSNLRSLRINTSSQFEPTNQGSSLSLIPTAPARNQAEPAESFIEDLTGSSRVQPSQTVHGQFSDVKHEFATANRGNQETGILGRRSDTSTSVQLITAPRQETGPGPANNPNQPQSNEILNESLCSPTKKILHLNSAQRPFSDLRKRHLHDANEVIVQPLLTPISNCSSTNQETCSNNIPRQITNARQRSFDNSNQASHSTDSGCLRKVASVQTRHKASVSTPTQTHQNEDIHSYSANKKARLSYAEYKRLISVDTPPLTESSESATSVKSNQTATVIDLTLDDQPEPSPPDHNVNNTQLKSFENISCRSSVVDSESYLPIPPQQQTSLNKTSTVTKLSVISPGEPTCTYFNKTPSLSTKESNQKAKITASASNSSPPKLIPTYSATNIEIRHRPSILTPPTTLQSEQPPKNQISPESPSDLQSKSCKISFAAKPFLINNENCVITSALPRKLQLKNKQSNSTQTGNEDFPLIVSEHRPQTNSPAPGPTTEANRPVYCSQGNSSANSRHLGNYLRINQDMYPMTMDQSRQENIPAQHTLQVHMHHLCCPCSNVIYPYYPPGYRPPLLAQPPPIPRPSYLHHYQYTQLHVNPAYNVPLPPPMTQHLPQGMNHSPPSTVDLAFGPPPRDRRNLENQDYDDQRQISDKNKTENRNSLLQYAPLPLDNSYGAVNVSENLQETFRSLTATQVASLSTENYIKYLDNGCFIGETIAKRNEQRPCFKNIQNLCNRTRSEVMKPNITVSNIHSQGVPWATKDFIFAFVRAINCWCILRGYLGCKDGNLGKIDREISPEFRACYAKWERCTKQLTHYLIQTFYKLDEANSSPNLNPNNSQSHPNPAPSTSTSTTTVITRTRNPSPAQETPRKHVQVLNEPTPHNTERKLSNKEMAALKGIPGILHIRPTSSADLGEVRNPNSESTEISPRDEDSDSESRVYMKPGSYNVPTKQQSSQSTTNSPRSIEFLDTAQNVAAHHRKVASEKPDSYTSEILRDKVWQTAQNVTPEFIKQNEESASTVGAEKFYDMAVQQNKHIESWLNNELNLFDCVVPDGDEENIQQSEDMLQSAAQGKLNKGNETLTSRCDSLASVDLEAASRSYRNRPTPKNYSTFRRNFSNKWEYKSGGLTDAALIIFDRILKELERTEFSLQINLKISYAHSDENEVRNPTDLSTISKKLKNKTHANLNEVLHDFRHIICCSSEFFADVRILKQLAMFRDKFEEMISHAFPGIDFNHITGEPNEMLGPLVLKQRGRPRKIAEGDGDH